MRPPTPEGETVGIVADEVDHGIHIGQIRTDDHGRRRESGTAAESGRRKRGSNKRVTEVVHDVWFEAAHNVQGTVGRGKSRTPGCWYARARVERGRVRRRWRCEPTRAV